MDRLSLLLSCAFALSACDDAESGAMDPMDTAGGKQDDADGEEIDTRGYHFVLNDGDFSVRRDHAGAPLLATIWGRHSEYSVEAPHVEKHAFNDSDDADGLPWPGHIVARFVKIHKSWAPSFEAMGLNACDPLGLTDDWDELFADGELNIGALQPENCFAQKVVWRNRHSGELERYRPSISLALPDYLTLNLEDPPGYPNGRVLEEQINSLVFSQGFLAHGKQCGDAKCDLYTLWHRDDFLKPLNDVPFFGATEIGAPPAAFPFLAPPHRMR